MLFWFFVIMLSFYSFIYGRGMSGNYFNNNKKKMYTVFVKRNYLIKSFKT